MDADRIAILSNPYSGSGKERVLELTRQAFECLRPQVSEILVGPGDMGEAVCQGDKVTVVGQDNTKTRQDTIETAKQMVEKGVELFVIVSGDGTYNDALEGIKSLDVTLPIFGIAAGRFNVIFPKRVHDPFVSMRGNFRPFAVKDLVVEDVMGLVSRVNDKIVSYGFFWVTVANVVAHSDADGNFVTIDAAQYIDGKVVPLFDPPPIATEETQITLLSSALGEIELASRTDIAMPVVAHLVPEINQIVAGGFGMMAESMGFHGVAYCFPSKVGFMPTPESFPVETRALAFFAGDKVRYTGLRDGSVLQVDSTAIRTLSSDDVLTVEVVLKLGEKAVLKPY
ncbi:MAG: NAD(+)/NADH kinase [Chloroflexota bacterium]|nr:NAD(+)/NADH kinase [Chloroflexota bacterium]